MEKERGKPCCGKKKCCNPNCKCEKCECKKKEISREEQLEKELEETREKYLRARADYENLVKRTQKQAHLVREDAVSDFVGSLLPIVDNFEASLKMSKEKKEFIEGVEMIHKKLLSTLKEHKIEGFEPQIGQEFDATRHNAISIEEEGEKGKIVEVIKKGYKYGHNDKIIREAEVKVGGDERTSGNLKDTGEE